MDDPKSFETDAIHEENPLIQDRTVVAVFASVETAETARDALKTAGYKDVTVTSPDPDGDGKPVHEHGFWNGLKSIFGHHHDDTPLYGEALRRGNSLVSVHTQQGRSAYAIDILDGFAPVDIQGGEQAWTAEGWSRDTVAQSPLGAPDAGVDDSVGSVADEDLLLGSYDPNAGNERVRSYVANLPVVVVVGGEPIDDTGTIDNADQVTDAERFEPRSKMDD